MKDHQIAAMVNNINKAVRQLCPDAPQSLRQTISRVVNNEVKPMNETNEAFEARVKEIIQIEIPHWQNGGTNFTSVLLTLICKSQSTPHNWHRLKLAFPEEVEGFRRWNDQGWDELS